MCQLTDDFLLCSCDEENLTDPDWILEHLDDSLELRQRRGRVASQRFNDAERTLQQTVLDGLTRGCFDFDYTPSANDVLRLRHNERWLRFRYVSGAWSLDDSNSLTGWRSQMVPSQHGKLGVGPSRPA
jgi:hypothetical protein